MHWTYKGKIIPLDHKPKAESYGFVYEITYTNGKKYIGRKVFWNTIKKHFTKKQMSTVTDKRKKTYTYVTKESNWQSYEGSAKYNKGLKVASKEILFICHSKRWLTYMEIKYQFGRDVLIDDTYINENINRMWYRSVMD